MSGTAKKLKRSDCDLKISNRGAFPGNQGHSSWGTGSLLPPLSSRSEGADSREDTYEVLCKLGITSL
ncbi:mCG142199 [Mus musculus]|nr:mCG142199 [Mus musculus]